MSPAAATKARAEIPAAQGTTPADGPAQPPAAGHRTPAPMDLALRSSGLGNYQLGRVEHSYVENGDAGRGDARSQGLSRAHRPLMR